jgi:type IV secretory pathway VirB2 component (pilin)
MQATMKKPGLSEGKQWAIAIGMALLMQHFGVFAADMGDPLCDVSNMLTGKTMLGVMFFAVIGGGMGVFFGGEMTDFLKIIAKLILVVGIILAFGQVGSLVWKAAGKGAVTCG